MESFFHLQLYFGHMCDGAVSKPGQLWVPSKMNRLMDLLPQRSDRGTDYLWFFVCLVGFV